MVKLPATPGYAEPSTGSLRYAVVGTVTHRAELQDGEHLAAATYAVLFVNHRTTAGECYEATRTGSTGSATRSEPVAIATSNSRLIRSAFRLDRRTNDAVEWSGLHSV